jgi:hypothetical protein
MQLHEVVTKMQARLLLNDQLIKQLEKEAKKRQDALDLKEQRINSACLALSLELINIQQMMMDKRKMAEYDVSGCWDRLKSLLAGQVDQENEVPSSSIYPFPNSV